MVHLLSQLDELILPVLQLSNTYSWTITFKNKEHVLKKMISILAFCALIGAFSSTSHAGIGIAGRAGTLGIGVEVTQSLVPMLNVRGGLNWFNYSFDGNESGVNYNIDLKLKSFTAMLDFHPIPLMGFRLTGGIVFNSNGLEMVSDQISGTIEVGGQQYPTGDVGNLVGNVDFKSTAPYFGIGWGNAANSRIGLAIDLGIALQGSPQVELSATGVLASDQTFRSSMNREVQELEDEISGFKYYPVISIGLSFKITP
jgi:hypothetical protein